MSEQPNEIILLDVAGQYNLLDAFLGDLRTAFETLGYTVKRINPEKSEDLNYIKQLALRGKAAAEQVKFVFRINYLNAYLRWGDNQNFFDVTGIPLFVWFVDHPCHHIQHVPRDIHNVLFGFVDDSHADFWNQRFHGQFDTGFVPHGSALHTHNEQPFSERPLDTVFFGSYNNPLHLRQGLISGDTLVDTLIEETLEMTLTDLQFPVHTHFLNGFLARGIEPFEFGVDILEQLLRQIDFYIRAWRRTQLIRAIHDIPLTVYGNGWEAFQDAPATIQFKPSQTFLETLNTMNQAKVVLNQNPFNQGGHERVFYSMAQGAVCYSDRTQWLEQHFTDNKTILFFDYANPQAINDQLVDAFNNSNSLALIATQGHLATQQNHTWVHRAKIIDGLVDAHRHRLHSPMGM